MPMRAKGSASMTRHGSAAKDVMVTGMGFCLPGTDQPVCNTKDLWEIASQGLSTLKNDGIYHCSVGLTKAEFDERVPGIPGTFSQHFTDAHRFGLISLTEAAADAGVAIMSGELA